MRKILILLIVVVPMTSQLAGAQTTRERLLVPIAILSPVPGAHGSLWTTELVARNLGTLPVHMIHVWPLCPPIGASCGVEADVPPNESVILRPEGAITSRVAAIIEADPADSVAFHLRVQDISRQAETWGTEIPVVRERELHTATLALVNVPVTAGFRNTLRIYDMDGRADGEVRIRIYAIHPNEAGPGVERPRPDELLGERRFSLIAPAFPEREPGYLELGNLNQIAPLGSAQRVTIEIEPLTPGLRFWAFVSVTNNATQHVTTVTPQ